MLVRGQTGLEEGIGRNLGTLMREFDTSGGTAAGT